MDTTNVPMEPVVFVLGKRFVVSRKVLMEMEYFKPILKKSLKNKYRCVINISDRCPESFKVILDYVMYGKISIGDLPRNEMYKFIDDFMFYGVKVRPVEPIENEFVSSIKNVLDSDIFMKKNSDDIKNIIHKFPVKDDNFNDIFNSEYLNTNIKSIINYIL